jgi:hypothetical protein
MTPRAPGAPMGYPAPRPGAPVARGTVGLLVAGALLLGLFFGGVMGLGVGFVAAGHRAHVAIERHGMMMHRPGFFGGPYAGHRWSQGGPQQGWSNHGPGPWSQPSGAASPGVSPSPGGAPSTNTH